MRRTAALLSLALVPALLVAAGTHSATAAPAVPAVQAVPAAHNLPYTKIPILIRVAVGPNHDMGCVIKADKYRPTRVGPGHPGPAILTTNGFGGSKDDAGQAGAASAFAKAGYVVISYSGLGFGGSTCKISLDDPDYDGLAGKQIVDVLAGTRPYTLDDGSGRKAFMPYISKETKNGHPTKDPKVGMLGGSYGGQIQFAVAEQDPRIDAIIPQITWNDLSYSLAPNNTDSTTGITYGTPGVAKKEWVDLFFGDGIAAGLENTQVDPTRNTGCPNFRDEACTAAAQLNSAGYPDDATLALARHASVASYLQKIRIPTLLVQGQHDTLFNLQEAAATYQALRAQGTEARMVWFSGGHSGDTAVGDFDLSKGVDGSYLGRRYIDWMDRYVRGISTATAGPQFEYFRNWVDYDTSPANAGTDIARAYARSSVPFTGTPTTTLYLSGTDTLSNSSTVGSGGAMLTGTNAGTSYSETSGVEGSTVNNPVSDTAGTFAAYTSPVLSQEAVLVGSPKLTLHLTAPAASSTQASGPAGKLVLFAKLYDVDSGGTQTLQYRLISPVRVKDVDQTVTVNLPAVAERFAAGHRIRLVVAAGDAAYANNTAAQTVTINTSTATPSTLGLPLVGSLAFQPGQTCASVCVNR
jgi:predicted acyl esterase